MIDIIACKYNSITIMFNKFIKIFNKYLRLPEEYPMGFSQFIGQWY